MFDWRQLIGVFLIALLPLLALFGVFGERSAHSDIASEDLVLQIEYPTRLRYKMTNPLVISVHNLSAQRMPTVTVSISADYIRQFSQVAFLPDLKRITEQGYEVELTDLQPNDRRQVVVEFQGERYGRHRGRISVSGTAHEPAHAMISTWVFP